MSGRATALAPSNIAFIKYWGTRDVDRTVPFNPSISMTLRRCATRTTVVRRPGATGDEVLLHGVEGGLEPATESFAAGVRRHLDRLREWSGIDDRFRVATENTFPMGTGLASSASGFAALALAVVEAIDRQVSPRRASLLAQSSGSGSAARSVFGGYVEWPAAGDREGAAAQLHPADHWDLRDVIAILDTGPKNVSSLEGHRRAPSSPYFEVRLAQLAGRLDTVRSALLERSFRGLASVVEEEAVDLHLIAMSSKPPVFYWKPGTLTVLERVRCLRDEGLDICATMDAGANVHVICTPSSEETVVQELRQEPEVQSLVRDGVGPGPAIIDDHLL